MAEERSLPTPYDAPDLYDRVFDGLTFDLDFWIAEGRAAHGPLLELACGTGRVLVRLLEAGLDVEGLDRYPAMLAHLRAKAEAKGFHPKLHTADMRDFATGRRYARIFCPFNGFAHADTTDDQIAALRRCREHLEDGGALVLHVSYPGVAYWSEPEGVPVLELETTDPATGGMLRLYDTRVRDRVAQRQQSVVEYRELDAGHAVVASHRFTTTQRWTYRYELELLFRAAGFVRWEVFGGFAREPLERDDQQMVAFAWRD